MWSRQLALLGLLTAVAVSGCKGKNVPPQARPKPKTAYDYPLRTVVVQAREIKAWELSSFGVLPKAFTKTKELPAEPLVNLGRMLFYETRLSKSHEISCNDCHDLADYGMDGQSFSIGHDGQSGKRNAPTVYNAAGHGLQFWDGRAATVEQQAKFPVLDALEMAMPSEDRILEVLRSMPEYVSAFKAAFPDQAEPISIDNFGAAIGAFERGLVTPSRWDKFRSGDNSALSPAELFGFQTFTQVGCPECHSGTLVGGSILETLGRSRPWPNQEDTGREQATRDKSQRMRFKTASLRNIEKTGPYFHDASSTTLDDAVRRMAKHQLGVELKPEQTTAIVTWLKTLTGEIDQKYIAEPALPKSTAATPKPDKTL
ncbi:MAG TPA: cytochrome c peroxidase [Polyangiaceae bacterium]|nr:cytochrome c peroxidase [Polyangiaceae bacterium]